MQVRSFIIFLISVLLFSSTVLGSNPKLSFNETCSSIIKKVPVNLYNVSCNGTLTLDNTANDTLYDFVINFTETGINFSGPTYISEINAGQIKEFNYTINSVDLNLSLNEVNETGNYSTSILRQISNISGILLIKLGLSKREINEDFEVVITVINPNNADVNLTDLELRREVANATMDPSLMNVLPINVSLPQVINASSNSSWVYIDSFNQSPMYVTKVDHSVVFNISENLEVLNYTEVNVTPFSFDITVPSFVYVGTNLQVQINSTNEGNESANVWYSCWIKGYSSQTLNNIFKTVGAGESYNPLMTLSTSFLGAGVYTVRCELNASTGNEILWEEETIVFLPAGVVQPGIGVGVPGIPPIEKIFIIKEVISNKTVGLGDIAKISIIIFNTRNSTKYDLMVSDFIPDQFELTEAFDGSFENETRILSYYISELGPKKYMSFVYEMKVIKSWRNTLLLPPAMAYEDGKRVGKSEQPVLIFEKIKYFLLVNKEITYLGDNRYIIKIRVENIGEGDLKDLTLVDFFENFSISEITPPGVVNRTKGTVFWNIGLMSPGERLYFQYRLEGEYEHIPYPQVLGIDPDNVYLTITYGKIISSEFFLSNIEPFLAFIIVIFGIVILYVSVSKKAFMIIEKKRMERELDIELESVSLKIRPIVRHEVLRISPDLEIMRANLPEVEKDVKYLFKEIKKEHGFEPTKVNPNTFKIITIEELRNILDSKSRFKGAKWFNKTKLKTKTK